MASPIIHKIVSRSNCNALVVTEDNLDSSQGENSSDKEDISCNICSRKFNRKGALYKHLRRMHKIEPQCNFNDILINDMDDAGINSVSEFCCFICGQRFSWKSSVYKHVTNIHDVDLKCNGSILRGGTKKDSFTIVLSCLVCGQKFTQKTSLCKHLRNTHNVDEENLVYCFKADVIPDENPDSAPFSCHICGKRFVTSSMMNQHLRVIHNADASVSFKIICPIENCQVRASSHTTLRQHLQSDHGIPLEKVEMDFSTEEDYLEWKHSVELEGFKYAKRNVIKLANGCRKTYLRCRRSGVFVSKSTGIKALNYNTSCQMNFHCPSTIEVTQGESIHVTFFPTHVGHGKEPKPRNRNVKRKKFCGEVSEDMPLERCLDIVKNSLNDRLRKIDTLTTKDLSGVKEPPSEKRWSNHCIDVNSYVKEMQKLGDLSPVIYYEEGSKSPHLCEDDFLLVLMTPCQKQMLELYVREILCIDSIHGADDHDFHLTAMVVVDQDEVSCPVSFCVSRRLDSYHIATYFRVISRVHDIVYTHHFITDDSKLYMTSWEQSNPSPKENFLCSWDVDKNWRENLSYIVPFEKKINVYKLLCMLMEETDIITFTALHKQFIDDLENDNDTEQFGIYFKAYYSMRTEQWAFCYRPNIDIKAQVSLEALHNVFKNIYLREKNCKRIDAFISHLMKIADQKMQDRYAKLVASVDSTEIQYIEQECAKSWYLYPHVKCLGDKKWEVKEHDANSTFVVTKIAEKKCETCQIVCEACDICFHVYTCDCPSSKVLVTICRHMHAVHMGGKFGFGHMGGDPINSTTVEKECVNEVEVSNPESHNENVENLDNCDIEQKLKTVLNLIKDKPFSPEKRRHINVLLDSVMSLIDERPLVPKENGDPTNKKIKL